LQSNVFPRRRTSNAKWRRHVDIVDVLEDYKSSFTSRDNLESPFNLICMFLGSGRKLEYPERTHAYTGRTYKLNTERLQPGFKPGTLKLWGRRQCWPPHHRAAQLVLYERKKFFLWMGVFFSFFFSSQWCFGAIALKMYVVSGAL